MNFSKNKLNMIDLPDLSKVRLPNGETCSAMVVQGICAWKQYTFVTAYCGIKKLKKDLKGCIKYPENASLYEKIKDEEVHNSVIFVFTDRHVATLMLPDVNHVGGIACDGQKLWIAKSSDNSLSTVLLEDVLDILHSYGRGGDEELNVADSRETGSGESLNVLDSGETESNESLNVLDSGETESNESLNVLDTGETESNESLNVLDSGETESNESLNIADPGEKGHGESFDIILGNVNYHNENIPCGFRAGFIATFKNKICVGFCRKGKGKDDYPTGFVKVFGVLEKNKDVKLNEYFTIPLERKANGVSFYEKNHK
ncbi:MAG: hypothetical protein K6G11_07800, partial [Lachnospiraceae bacterium]|nr:hypothetical protein [Lachnospiraceae bacterium]